MPYRLYFTTITFFISLIAFTQCPTGRYLQKNYAVDTIKNIVYGSNTPVNSSSITSLLMDIYLPKNDSSTERPLVIFAHGGSFITGNKEMEDMTTICTALAQRGYVAVSIEYRLEGLISLISTQKTITEVFRSVQDGKAAIRYFRKEKTISDTYKIDTAQIFFGGTSAGAILAFHLAYLDNNDVIPNEWKTWANSIGGFEGNSGNEGYSSKVKAIVSYAGAIGDTTWMKAEDIPWIDFHSKNDATVIDSTGYPLGIPTLPDLMGGKTMYQRAKHTKQPAEFIEFEGSAHPPFADGVAATWDTTESKTVRFLYKNLDCNPDKYVIISANNINDFSNEITMSPNPVSEKLFVKGRLLTDMSHFVAMNNLGQTFNLDKTTTNDGYAFDITHLTKGIYVLLINNESQNTECNRKRFVVE